MKRRYKAGDWLRVTLGGEYDALGIIARACRSRLFGYFFAVPSSHRPGHDDLRRLRAENALCAMLFGGAAIEDARWPMVARSLAFDPQVWPFPFFASRGAFGESWTQVRYDANTMQIVERRSIEAQAAAALPDARFADAVDAERFLRARIAGTSATRVQSVIELRSPIDPDRLRGIANVGTVQFSTPLSGYDMEALAAVVDRHPHVEVRVHGFRHGFDARALSGFTSLRSLALDVHGVQHPRALEALRELRTLRIGAAQTDLRFIEALPMLERLELRGTRASLEPVQRARSVRSLYLESTRPCDFRAFAAACELEALTLSHGEYDLDSLDNLRSLRHLQLCALDVPALPSLTPFEKLERLELSALHGVTALHAIARAPALRQLRIERMPQLNVGDFEALQCCAGLQVDVDIGSRSKEREVYRLLKGGKT